MALCLRLGLAVFLIASSCGGSPTATPANEVKVKDLPKNEYSDVIRLLNTSALAGGPKKLFQNGHVEKANSHAEDHGRPVHTDSVGISNASKKSSKTSHGKKYKTQKDIKKHSVKPGDKIKIGNRNLMNDSPYKERVRDVLSRRRISSKLVTETPIKAKLPQPLPQTAYQPVQYQPNYYNYQSPYSTYYKDYSFPLASPYIFPQHPFYHENSNWENQINIHQLPSHQVATVPHVEPPTLSWTAEIEYPNMAPIVVTDQNYTDNPNVEVLLHTASKSADSTEIPYLHTPVVPPQPTNNRPVSSWNARTDLNNPPPIIWSHGIPYVPLREPNYLGSSQPSPQYIPRPSYNSMANPNHFLIPPVYYQQPQNLPFFKNTPVQTWLPSYQPYYHASPLVPQQPNHNHHNHKANVQATHSFENGALHTSVFQNSKEVTGENLEVNVFPFDANAVDVHDNVEAKPKGAALNGDDDD